MMKKTIVRCIIMTMLLVGLTTIAGEARFQIPYDELAGYKRSVIDHRMNGRLERAIEIYDKILELEPDFYEAYKEKGILFYRLGEPMEAMENLDAFLETGLTAPEVYYIKALILEEAGDYHEAVLLHQRAIEERLEEMSFYGGLSFLSRTQRIPYFHLGYSLYKIEAYTESLTALKMAGDLHPSAEEIDLLKVKIYGELQNQQEALEVFRRLQSYYYRNPDDAYLQAMELYGEGQYQKAISYFEEALLNQPGNTVIYYQLGNAYLHLGQYQKALEMYGEITIITPQEAWGYLSGSFVYQYVGQYQMADHSFQEWKANNPALWKSLPKAGPILSGIIITAFLAMLLFLTMANNSQLYNFRDLFAERYGGQNRIDLNVMRQYAYGEEVDELDMDIEMLYHKRVWLEE
ncbi:tetratricopeptide repeat protein [Natronincola peptidivorans]|nr:tetratricopeptide repeat protein [Natronincola peptidivorans]